MKAGELQRSDLKMKQQTNKGKSLSRKELVTQFCNEIAAWAASECPESKKYTRQNRLDVSKK
jgi:hypothetical protein